MVILALHANLSALHSSLACTVQAMANSGGLLCRVADACAHGIAGMALGTGSALAHRAVDSVLGSRHPEPAQAQVEHLSIRASPQREAA